ncbi:MAG: hypothetical protein RL735_1981 [Pseudomonadota bacterium]|jgi:uncharacterized membrane protein
MNDLREERGTFLRNFHAHALRNAFLRPLVLRPRLIVGVLMSLAVYLALPGDWRPMTRLLVAWNSGAILYVALTTIMMIQDDPDRMRQRSSVEDEGRFVILILAIVAAIASIVAIVAQLVATKELHGFDRMLHIGLAGLTIISGWAFIHFTFALHYAHEYESERRKRPDLPEKMSGGLDFVDTTAPDYSDFLYFSFTIGVANQTADVVVCSPMMRRIVLVHSIVSFFYNTTILALTINIAAGLI